MRRTKHNYPTPRPFLKWAGGKGQLLGELRQRVAEASPFGRYHEPFVGGGALFFALCREGVLGRKKARLSDNNANLIDAYLGVQQNVDEVIKLLEQHRTAHNRDYYYRVRAHVPANPIARAARIIYLNKTCFNGLYRENRKGLFNVPMGRYARPIICDEENLRAASLALRRAKVAQRHFRYVLDEALEGDLVYFDPPYHPLSATSSFTGYDKGLFSEESQRELARVFAALSDRGVKVLLSNSMTDFVRNLYGRFRIDTVYATRSVNSRADRRGKVSEALIRNF